MKSDLRTKLEELEIRTSELEQHDNQIRAHVIKLSERLKSICIQGGINSSTKRFTIEHFAGGEEEIYGYLLAGEDGITLTYRSTLDDIKYAEDYEADARDARIKPDAWDTKWLRTIATKDRLEELVSSLSEATNALLQGRAATVESVRSAAAGPTAVAGERLTAIAGELSFGRVKSDFARALRLVAVDPPAATTAACVLLETTLKHIINKLNLETPNDMQIRTLYKPVAAEFGLKTGGAELHAISNALNTVIQNIGSFRSGSGDAHGRAPGQENASTEEADFVVTAAAAISTFLMRRLAMHQEIKSTSPTTPNKMAHTSISER
ncbi:abortive infection family protein [Myxococcus sp. AM009]|uniref:abortive infection family protein n=1 Tax=Myxococcus sp. AM009 TaxID=2745137 RepID=UPI001594F783|nr:abortive infection family protein [Myxococcus sp. AM009]NVI98712.1 abortive infection family protein [Myxococcus sp. AM009]